MIFTTHARDSILTDDFIRAFAACLHIIHIFIQLWTDFSLAGYQTTGVSTDPSLDQDDDDQDDFFTAK